MEKVIIRTVQDQGSGYGIVRFNGQAYEPTNPNTFINKGDKVIVRRITDFTIGVRKITRDGFGGEETWSV